MLAITLAALALILGWFTFDTTRPWLWLGVGMLVGGALGNLIDRIREGAVTDFIDPPLWPAFNVADVSITVGVAIIALSALSPEPGARGIAAMSGDPRLVHVDEHLAVIDKPAGLVVHAGARDTAGRRSSSARRSARRRRARAPRNRSPARPRHLRPDDRRPRRRGASPPRGDDQGTASPARLPRAGRGPAAVAHGDDRRSARPRPPGAAATGRPRARGAGGAHALRGPRGCCRPTRSSRRRSKPAVRTRSGPTSRRSATRSPATRATATPAATGSNASSCTAPSCGSSTRSRVRLSSSRPISPTTWPRRWSGPGERVSAASAVAVTRR